MTARSRQTRQRDVIRNAFESADRPLGPQEIHSDALKEIQNLGMATVYRTINLLLEEGWLKAVDLPGESPRYEVAGKPHHHHFVCRTCDRVFEVNACPGDLRRLTPKGFQTEHHEIVLYGLCESCAA